MDAVRVHRYVRAMTHPDRILPGVALMIAFCIIAPLIDIFSKLATAAIPVGEITAARFLVQAVLMAPIVAGLGLSYRMSARGLRLTVLRSVFLILSTYSFVSAVAVMPVPDALTIAFVEPFIILIAGHFLFREQVGPRRIAACAVGFLGALLVIRPSFAQFGTVALWPLGTAFCFAAYMMTTRSLSRDMHPVAMQFHTAWVGFALSLPVLLLAEGSGIAELDPIRPEGRFWFFLFGVGLASTVSHMAITYALKFAPSSTLAPLHYLEIIAAVGFSYLLFGTFPSAMTWAGIGIIVASGLYIIHREHAFSRTGHSPSDPPVTGDLSAPR